MKAAFLSEFAAVRGIAGQFFLVYAVVAVCIGFGTKSPAAMVASLAAMAPFMFLFTLASWDTANGWERFRATLPVSRTALVVSRYATILWPTLVALGLGIALAYAMTGVLSLVGGDLAALFVEEASQPAMLVFAGFAGMSTTMVLASLMLPAVMRFNMTKALRVFPVVVALIMFAAIALVPNLERLPALAAVQAWFENPATLPAALLALVGATLAIYALSCLVSIALYRRKDL